MKNKNILIILPAQKFNEQEFVITKTILTRAGFNLFVASDTASLCTGDKNLRVRADMNFYNISEPNFCGIIFIGGIGAKEYWENKSLHMIINQFNDNCKIVAAICVAPVILANAGILNSIKAVCFPTAKSELTKMGAVYIDKPVVISKNIITAQDYNAADEFVFNIISIEN